MAIRLPVLSGTIKRRMLINFRADPELVQRILPPPFRPKLHRDWSIVGICLIRLEGIRPRGLPSPLGVSSENAAHRIAVEWTDTTGDHEGVFIPRRDTGSLLNRLAGGRVFPGEHNHANFSVRDSRGHIDLAMQSFDGTTSIQVVADEADSLPATSCFASISEASAFFEGGSVGYSVTYDVTRLDGLLLRTLEWRVRALNVTQVDSSFFSDNSRFPQGSIKFDHGLIMRDLKHEWHKVQDLFSLTSPQSV